MNMEDLIRVEFSEDGGLGVRFSESFLSSSHEEQLQALEAFFWKKTLEPSTTHQVDKAMTEHEIMMIVAETLLAKLRRGERLERDSNIDILLEDLMAIQSVEGPASEADIARFLEEGAEGGEGGGS